MTTKKSSAVDQYVAGFPASVQTKLRKIRSEIRKTAPEAVESISYGIAGYKIGGKPFIYFAGFKNHVGMYPIGSQASKSIKGLERYLSGAGTAKFPLSEPLPLKIVSAIVKHRLRATGSGSKP